MEELFQIKKTYFVLTIFLLGFSYTIFSFLDNRAFASAGSCEDAQATGISGSGSSVSYSAPDSNVISSVCIKSGSDMFTETSNPDHSGQLGNGTHEDSCYTVSGVGTGTVTVTKNLDGSSCQDISHIDVYYDDDEEVTPTPTSTPTPTPTDTPTPTPTDTLVPTNTPTPTDAPLLAPTSTPTPTQTQSEPTPTLTPTPTQTSNNSSSSSGGEGVTILATTNSNSSPTPQGEVLGVSTSNVSDPGLPEAGTETSVLIIGFLSSLSGLSLIKIGLHLLVG